MARYSLLSEFIAFIKHEKKWWLIPLLLVLALVSLLAFFAETSPIGPFLYEIF